MLARLSVAPHSLPPVSLSTSTLRLHACHGRTAPPLASPLPSPGRLRAGRRRRGRRRHRRRACWRGEAPGRDERHVRSLPLPPLSKIEPFPTRPHLSLTPSSPARAGAFASPKGDTPARGPRCATRGALLGRLDSRRPTRAPLALLTPSFSQRRSGADAGAPLHARRRCVPPLSPRLVRRSPCCPSPAHPPCLARARAVAGEPPAGPAGRGGGPADVCAERAPGALESAPGSPGRRPLPGEARAREHAGRAGGDAEGAVEGAHAGRA